MSDAAPPAPAAGSTYVLQMSGGSLAFDAAQVGAAAGEVVKQHVLDATDVGRSEKLRRAAEEFLLALVAHTPSGPERSTAISKVREALMWGNAAIAMKGR